MQGQGLKTSVLGNTFKSTRGRTPEPPVPDRYVMDFVVPDWNPDPGTGLKVLTVPHNLGSRYPDVNIKKLESFVYVHEVSIPGPEEVKLYVPDGDEFAGTVYITV